MDVKTCCAAPGCGQCYDTKRGLAQHLAYAGDVHREAHQKARKAAAIAAGFASRSNARPFACTYPGCGRTYKSAFARKIHQSLMGHQPPKDHTVHGDGEQPTPTHPAHRPPAA